MTIVSSGGRAFAPSIVFSSSMLLGLGMSLAVCTVYGFLDMLMVVAWLCSETFGSAYPFDAFISSFIAVKNRASWKQTVTDTDLPTAYEENINTEGDSDNLPHAIKFQRRKSYKLPVFNLIW